MNYYEHYDAATRAVEIIGILLVIAGFIMRYRINRRRYYKRFEQTKMVSFERKWTGDLGSGFMVFLSIACIVVGLIMALIGWVNSGNGKAKEEAAKHHHTTTIP